MTINKALLPMKAHYFLFNAGTAPVQPFMSTLARQLGFSSFVVGVFYTIFPVSGMIAKPVMGAIADHFRAKKLIFLISLLATAIGFYLVSFVPELPVTRAIKFACDGSEAFLDTCWNSTSDTSNKCAAGEIVEQSGMAHCKLICPMQNSYWNTVCNNWNAIEYCNRTADSLTFTANLKLDQTIDNEGCLYFKVANVTMESGNTHYPNCPTEETRMATVCDMICDSFVLNDLVAQPAVSDSEVYDYYQYWAFLLLMVCAWMGQAVVVSVGDAICFDLLGDKPERYGHQRLYGALGWGLFSVATGFMIDAFSEGQSKKDYTSAFYLSLVILVLNMVVAWKIQYSQSKLSQNILKDVGLLLVHIPILIYMIWCICVGMCTGLMWNFYLWLVEDLAAAQGCDSYNWIKTLEGILMAVQTLGGELPFFFLSGWILTRIGHINSMTLVLLAIGVRFVLYSVVQNPWWFLPIEFSNGLTFGLFYACMASYASIVAPPGTEATVQGLVGAVFEGVGVSLGSLLGGYLFDKVGGQKTFQLFGVGALVACLVHAAVQYLWGRRKPESSVVYHTPKNALYILKDEDQEVKLVSF